MRRYIVPPGAGGLALAVDLNLVLGRIADDLVTIEQSIDKLEEREEVENPSHLLALEGGIYAAEGPIQASFGVRVPRAARDDEAPPLSQIAELSQGSFSNSAALTVVTPGSAGVAGTSTSASRSDHQHTVSWILTGTTVWNPPAIPDGSQDSQNVTVTGAVVGDAVFVGFSVPLVLGCWLFGEVVLANTVRVQLLNRSGLAQDFGSGTLRAVVFRL